MEYVDRVTRPSNAEIGFIISCVWAKKFDVTFVVSGPVLSEPCLKKIAQTICVPSKFFKVVMVRSGADLYAIGFVMPQAYSVSDIMKYAVSVDKVEALTGLDFFPNVPMETQERMEANESFAGW